MHSEINRNPWHLVIGISGLSSLGWLIHTFPPTKWYLILLFFILVFFSVTNLFLFILNNVRRAILIGSGVAIFFFIRYLLLREWFYIALLIACLFSLELYFKKR